MQPSRKQHWTSGIGPGVQTFLAIKERQRQKKMEEQKMGLAERQFGFEEQLAQQKMGLAERQFGLEEQLAQPPTYSTIGPDDPRGYPAGSRLEIDAKGKESLTYKAQPLSLRDVMANIAQLEKRLATAMTLGYPTDEINAQLISFSGFADKMRRKMLGGQAEDPGQGIEKVLGNDPKPMTSPLIEGEIMGVGSTTDPQLGLPRSATPQMQPPSPLPDMARQAESFLEPEQGAAPAQPTAPTQKTGNREKPPVIGADIWMGIKNAVMADTGESVADLVWEAVEDGADAATINKWIELNRPKFKGGMPGAMKPNAKPLTTKPTLPFGNPMRGY